MKAITIDSLLTPVCENALMLGKFGVAHGISNSIQIGVGIGYPIISVGKNWDVF